MLLNMNTEFILSLLILSSITQKCAAGNLNITLDDIIQRRVRQFIDHCPDTSTCAKNVTELPEELYPSWRYKPCCQPCNCSDSCGLNCCPDRSGHLESEEALFNASKIVRCVDSQYRGLGYHKHNGLSYKMVAECPYNYNDTEIQMKCRREYSDITFDVPLRYILPAYDNLTESNYKNIYCAQCHNVELEHLVFASLTYECYDMNKKGLKGLTYIRDLTANLDSGDNDHCNILFTPYQGNVCHREFVDRCNSTGRWHTYDREIEASCLSYTSVYKNKYKNVHCNICNGNIYADIERSCKDYHTGIIGIFYTTIIDFSRPHGAFDNVRISRIDKDDKNYCHSSSIYDIEKRSDWNVQCPVGMTLSIWNMMCQPTETVRISSMTIEISLTPDPQSRVKESLQNILLNLTKEIEGKIDLLVTRDVAFGRIQVTIHFKDRFILNIDTNMQIDLQFIRSIDARIEIMINPMKQNRSLFETVLDISLVFTKLLRYGNFVAKFKHFKSEFYDKQNHLQTCRRDNNQPLVMLCIYMPAQTSDTLNINIFHKIFEQRSSTHIFEIEPEPFCPRVVLPKLSFADDLITCNDSTNLSAILTESFLSKTLTVFNTHRFFCHEDYFQHISNMPKKYNHMKDEKGSSPDTHLLIIMYLTISCLSVSLLSLSLTLIIYSVFKDLRTLPGMNNMALVISLFVFQTMSLVNTITDVETVWLCSFFAVVTHFSFVNSFSWMFICTFHMLKVFFHIKHRTVARNDSSTFAFYTIFTTSIAIVAVASTVIIAEVQSSGNDMGYGGYGCYIKNPIMIMCAAAIPAAIVIVLNLGMFFVTVFKISKHPNMSSSGARERSNIAIFAKLSTLTGLTWVFGFVFVFTKLNAFAYIFVILNAAQGLFIMLSFVCNKRVWSLICSKLSKQTVT